MRLTMRRWIVVLLVTAVGAPAAAAPTIDVRARTRVSVDAVVRTGAGVHIRGTLADATTGEGVVGRHVLLEIDGGQRQVTTVAGPGGRFDATVDVPAGRTRSRRASPATNPTARARPCRAPTTSTRPRSR